MQQSRDGIEPARIGQRILIVMAVLTALAALFIGVQQLWALEVPRLQGRVNDYANMIGSATQQQLEAMLADLERSDGTQIVVLTIPELQGDALEDFSIRVAEKWGIGQKANDNGAILLISKNDRKIRIEVGYGLEGRLTDLMAGRIIRNVIAPQFKMGRFDQGIMDGVSAMVGTVKGEYEAPASERRPGKNGPGSSGLVGLIVLFMLLNVLGRVNRWVGAGLGGVLAPIAGALLFGAGALAILALIPIGVLGGFLLGTFGAPLSFGHTLPSSRRGTHWGGGGFGGFSGGGGFGGFSGGGGGFGGGGASGGW